MHQRITRRGMIIALREGGWVLLVTGIILLGLLVWATAPALLRKVQAPPGDGKHIESYGFDLSNLAVRPDLVVPALLHRDMLPRWDFPDVARGTDMTRINAEMRGKYVVSGDRVIGIVIDGVALAYPISVMNVHEIINDRVSDTDIVVTYNWQCDAARTYRRSLQKDGSAPTFGHTGLFYNSATLMYDLPTTRAVADSDAANAPSLWSQFTGQCIAGPRAGERLESINSQITTWSLWLAMHPDTAVILPDPGLRKRYQRGSPDSYFRSNDLFFPVAATLDPANMGGAKDRVIRIMSGGETRDYPVPAFFTGEGNSDRVTAMLGGTTLRFHLDRAQHAVYVEWAADATNVRIEHALAFAWHAFDAVEQLAP